MNINYDAAMLSEILHAKGKKILLHCCCAPCASVCFERLEDLKITAFFYNPNIEREEYFKRLDEFKRFLNLSGAASRADCEYDGEEFIKRVRGLEYEKEGGKRCEVCYRLRLEKTKEFAEANGFDYFATTLTLSPLKNAQKINEIGLSLQDGKVKYLPTDFKKRGGYLRSLALSKQYNLYRQNFCGCSFSRRDKKESIWISINTHRVTGLKKNI